MTTEKYNPEVIGVNGTFTSDGSDEIEGFLCQTAGTITVVDSRSVSVVTALPVTAGSWTRMPFYLGYPFTVTLAGGASGTLAVG